MSHPKLHLIAPAGSCREFLKDIHVETPAKLIAMVQEAVGSDYLVTGDEAIIGAVEDDRTGGRHDDQARAADVQRALEDSNVVAMVALRGGSWFTRILPGIDFSVLDRRSRPIAVFGFSEMTTLVNIVGAHRNGIGIYDISPAFLSYGLHRQERLANAAANRAAPASRELEPARNIDSRLHREFLAFFQDVVSMIEGRGSSRQVTARVVRGPSDGQQDRFKATFVGGNLCVLTTLLGSPYREAVMPTGKWLAIEEFNEHPYRLDRFLAQLTLAGLWKECAGLLLGDFHKGETDLGPAVEALLAYHLPPNRDIPVLATKEVGHTWPMSPLPLHQELTIERIEVERYSLHYPATALRVV